MDLQLQDKVVLVTGGARGLGRAISLTMAAEGARVAVNYRRRQEDALATARAIDEQFPDGQRAITAQADVTREEDVEKLFDRVESGLGPIDVLVNNAGSWPTAWVRDMTIDQWNAAVAVNLTGAFLTCREAMRRWIPDEDAVRRPGMAGTPRPAADPTSRTPRGKRIINITSQAAHHGATSGHSHYAAAKAGLMNFTQSLAREAAPHGVTVNAVAPGVMPTEMIQDALDADGARYLARIPLRRWGDPFEVAAAVAFLASDQAGYITGATLDVNGGMVMR